MSATDLATTVIANTTSTSSKTSPATAPSMVNPPWYYVDLKWRYIVLKTTAVAPSILTTVTCSPGSYTSWSLRGRAVQTSPSSLTCPSCCATRSSTKAD